MILRARPYSFGNVASMGGPPPIIFVTSVGAHSANGNDVTTGAVDTTGANFLVAMAGYYGTGTPPTLSDSKSNTWTALTLKISPDTSINGRLYYCAGATVGSGHTFSLSGTGVYPAVAVLAMANVKASPFDQQNGATTTSGNTSLATGSITPSVNGCVIVAGLVGNDSTGGDPTIDSGFSTPVVGHATGGQSVGAAISYKIQTTAAAVNPTWSWTNSGSEAVAVIASFKPGP